MSDHGDIRFRHSRARNRSIALLWFGIVALMPPMVGSSLIGGTVFGLPVPVFYVFLVWVILIAGGYLLSRALDEGGTNENVSGDDL